MDEKHIEASLRAAWANHPDAMLDQLSRDESLRQIERDVAKDMLRERESAKNIAQADAAKQQRLEARTLAKEAVDDSQDRQTLSAATGQRRVSQGPSKNQDHAENFAAMLRSSGLNAKARATQRIQGRDVHDGWQVNVRDDAQEIGIVACWHGRQHFVCYLEITGHAERTEEAADIMLAAMRFAWGDGAQLA